MKRNLVPIVILFVCDILFVLYYSSLETEVRVIKDMKYEMKLCLKEMATKMHTIENCRKVRKKLIETGVFSAELKGVDELVEQYRRSDNLSRPIIASKISQQMKPVFINLNNYIKSKSSKLWNMKLKIYILNGVVILIIAIVLIFKFKNRERRVPARKQSHLAKLYQIIFENNFSEQKDLVKNIEIIDEPSLSDELIGSIFFTLFKLNLIAKEVLNIQTIVSKEGTVAIFTQVFLFPEAIDVHLVSQIQESMDYKIMHELVTDQNGTITFHQDPNEGKICLEVRIDA
jgi:hypothetical protein